MGLATVTSITLTTDDELPAYDCQDGGYDPSSKPPEKHEEKKEKTAKEIKEDKNKTPEAAGRRSRKRKGSKARTRRSPIR